MHASKLGHILLLGALTVLPGCLAINAALGLLGTIGPPAAQLAGAAYTVAEYSYEYGAHDRTPDEVFLAKFDWLMDDRDEPEPAAFAGALSAAIPERRMTDSSIPRVTVVDVGDEIETGAGLIVMAETKQAVLPRKATPAATVAKTPSSKRVVQRRTLSPRITTNPRDRRTIQDVPLRTLPPVHTYVAHAPNPLQTRLDRLENGLAQAEALYLSGSTEGLRLSVSPCDGDPRVQGVNGGHSLRLLVTPTIHGAPST
ncbi:hypothetical protein [uncultured Pseudodesulfovibrio sp.]|uniref:hypothetical protein n=1 Tax=uncultured Pseudodesulfovibrio sp. TaxID=2035858 RepID=UPI0029C82D3E|nr:hypothetical protein [uncultured Pseudodesulfovibrio sp.]